MENQDVSRLEEEEEFTCLASSTSADVWYIDSGASTHMRIFLELSRLANGLPDYYGKQNEVYSSRERRHSILDRSRDQHPSH